VTYRQVGQQDHNAKFNLGSWGFDQPERRRIAGMTKRSKHTIQLTGFPGNPNVRILLLPPPPFSSANVNGFPGFIET
jgi:hypothetical protein